MKKTIDIIFLIIILLLSSTNLKSKTIDVNSLALNRVVSCRTPLYLSNELAFYKEFDMVKKKKKLICEVCSSKKRVHRNRYSGKNLCRYHFEEFSRYGKFFIKEEKNEINLRNLKEGMKKVKLINLKKYGSTKTPKERKKISLFMKKKWKDVEYSKRVRRKIANTNTKEFEDCKYRAKHKKINDQYGKATYCELNKNHKTKKYVWANINHQYNKKINEWIRLCDSCHRLLDNKKIDMNVVKKVIKSRKLYEIK